MRASYLRSVSAQALARLLYILSGTVAFVAVARLLGPYELGRYALVINLQNLAVTAADLGTTSLLARNLVTVAEHRSYAGSFMMFRLALGGAVGVTMAALTLALAPLDLMPALLVCAALLPLNAARFFDPIFQFQGRPYRSAWLAGLYAVALGTLNAAALMAPSDRATWSAAAFAVAGGIYGLAGLVVLMRTVRPRLDRSVLPALPAIGRAALPLGVIGLLSMLTLRLDVLMVEWLGGSLTLGLYNAAFRFFDLGVAVIVTLVTPLVPVLARLATQERARLAAAFATTAQAVAAALSLCAILAPRLGPTVLTLLYGPAYAVAGPALGLLAWKLLLGTLNLLLISYLMSIGPIGWLWLGSAAALGVNLALNLVLIPAFGLQGAAQAAMLCELPQLLVTLWFVSRAGLAPWAGTWWPRLLGAILAGTLASAIPAPALLQAAISATVFLVTLSRLSAWPANPLPLLHVDLRPS